MSYTEVFFESGEKTVDRVIPSVIMSAFYRIWSFVLMNVDSHLNTSEANAVKSILKNIVWFF